MSIQVVMMGHTRLVHSRGVRLNPNDMPMIGKLTRESKKRNVHGWHRYVLVLKFAKSRRHYGDEIIHAVDKKQALKLARRMYPSAKVR